DLGSDRPRSLVGLALTLISQHLTLVGLALTLISQHLTLVGLALTLISQHLTLVGLALTLIRQHLPLTRLALTLISQHLTLARRRGLRAGDCLPLATHATSMHPPQAGDPRHAVICRHTHPRLPAAQCSGWRWEPIQRNFA